jgi:hypothetical protein
MQDPIASIPDLTEWASSLDTERMSPDSEQLTRWQDEETSVRIHPPLLR